MDVFIWIIILLLGAAFAFKMAYAFSIALVLPATKGALYVSTSRVRIAAFMDAVPMNSGQLLADLGCGDGRVLRHVRKRYGVQAVGFEINPLAYLKVRVACFGVQGVKIRLQNFWRADLTGVDIVFCYLFPDVMKSLSAKLRSELKPGAVIVSCNFALPGLTPERVLRPGNSLNNDPIYIYRIGT
jgi:SAM-dependent methyltransferase